MNIQRAQKEIQSKNIALCDVETLKYAKKPIGKALLRGRKKLPIDDKAKPTDKIVCDVCGKTFVRSNRAWHKRTEIHRTYEKLGDNVKKMLLND